ncbi:MAG: BatB protein [Gammaproteobacteria bacterium CG22_combo_CG10-13_8_21_14_all_40_8]|nr:MAG: BatB protein [Gammaproteobacteria bacterium CG22_combo_CG10-13_8_21_14_all_40_8]
MITLNEPWVLLLIPLPIIVRYTLSKTSQTQQNALLTPFFQQWSQQTSSLEEMASTRLPLLLASICWLLLVLSAANPLWIGDPIVQPREGREIMLAMDISGSMEERDMITSKGNYRRIDVVKAVLSDFASRRENDKLGLILFGQQAFLQTPLTFDHQTIQKMLDEAIIGLAGANATAIGDAIGLVVKRFQSRKAKDKVLILLTDGVNNTGLVTPDKAAELAASQGIKIYTIGVGAGEMQVSSIFGTRTVNPSADLDEVSLKYIAKTTGGRYFRAKDPKELQQIYQLIDKLEPITSKSITIRPQKSLFYWSLFAAIILALVSVLFIQRHHLSPFNSPQKEVN